MSHTQPCRVPITDALILLLIKVESAPPSEDRPPPSGRDKMTSFLKLLKHSETKQKPLKKLKKLNTCS